MLMIFSVEVSAKLCYEPYVNLEAFLFVLEKRYFAAQLFQEFISIMELVAFLLPSFPPSLLSTADHIFSANGF